MNSKYMLDESNYTEFDSIGTVGLVGHSYSYEDGMWPSGNCFSVHNSKTDEDFRIVNFGYENIKMLLELNIVEYPIKIWKLDEGIAIVHDKRIPNRFYWGEYCTCCCPNNLLPLPQRARHDLGIQRGQINHNGSITSVNFVDEYDGCGVEKISCGTWEELRKNRKDRKEAYLKQFNDYHDKLVEKQKQYWDAVDRGEVLGVYILKNNPVKLRIDNEDE